MFVAATIGLGLYTAAFVCEAIRSGVNSIPLGQAEAARAIGMTFTQSMASMILPQAFRAVIPPLANTYIALAKNTSVALAIGVTEASFVMKKLRNDNASDRWRIFFGFASGYIVIVLAIAAIAAVARAEVEGLHEHRPVRRPRAAGHVGGTRSSLSSLSCCSLASVVLKKLNSEGVLTTEVVEEVVPERTSKFFVRASSAR